MAVDFEMPFFDDDEPLNIIPSKKNDSDKLKSFGVSPFDPKKSGLVGEEPVS